MLRKAYLDLITSAGLSFDKRQVSLLDLLSIYLTPPRSISRLFRLNEYKNGVYIHGTVGSGKTMLMDLFYKTLSRPKHRAHFNEFMLEIHQSLHKLRSEAKPRINFLPFSRQSIISFLVKSKMLPSYQVLCLDEFQVTDIADAMLLKQLINESFRAGIVMMMTSNRAPRDLYLNGIQREYFIPCIELIEQRMHVYELANEHDYRVNRNKSSSEFKIKTSKEGLLEQAGVTSVVKLKTVYGRQILVKVCAVSSSCVLDFNVLQEGSWGAPEFLTIINHFKSIYLHSVPIFTNHTLDAARRFITLIDILYDHDKTPLTMHAECNSLEELFNGVSPITSQEANHIDLGDLEVQFGIDSTLAPKLSSLISEERFAMKRTISRLHELLTTHRREEDAIINDHPQIGTEL